MREGILLVGIGIISTTLSFAQVKKQFSIDDNSNIQQVDLDFGVNSGSCLIKASETSELLTVYGSKDHDSYSHSFNKEIDGAKCKIKLMLEDNRSDGLSRSISHRMFGPDEKASSDVWKLFLSPEKSFDLNLKYGIGNADIDLSNLSIEKIKIKTGSADVHIKASEYNKVKMDTFYVQVDMGSVQVNNINLSKSEHVIADVGFGDLLLDFSDKALLSTKINSSVGAGNLMIILPTDDTPVRVKISESWLCQVMMLKSLKSIGDNTFVNATYEKDAPNLLSFDLDVSMGKIIFSQRNSPSNNQ